MSIFKRKRADPRPARTELEFEVKAIRRGNWMDNPGAFSLKAWQAQMIDENATLLEAKQSRAKAAKTYLDLQTWTGAMWALREDEMDARQRKIDSWIRDKRPILSLTNLDPYGPYVFRHSFIGRLHSALSGIRF